jgi:hypothetical protein
MAVATLSSDGSRSRGEGALELSRLPASAGWIVAHMQARNVVDTGEHG